MTAMRLKRYPSPSGGIALGKMGVGARMMRQKVPFLRITPTTTAFHYPPFNTGVTYDSTDAMKIEVEWRIVPNSAIGSWGTLFGNTNSNAFNGFMLRHFNATDEAIGQAPLSTNTSTTGSATQSSVGNTDWGVMLFDTGAGTGEVIKFNGTSVVTGLQWFDASRWATTTVPFYIGDGPRGYGATIATDWRRVRFWKNGTLIKDYIPDADNCFFDLVSQTKLLRDTNSNTTAVYMTE